MMQKKINMEVDTSALKQEIEALEKRQFVEALIDEIQIYEERQPSGQWLKSIKFTLPIIEEDFNMSLDNDAQVETVCLLEKT